MNDKLIRMHASIKIDSSRPDFMVRRIARAVIRRVMLENPGCRASEIRTRVEDANPFADTDESLMAIWADEVSWVVPSLNAALN